MRGKVAKRLRKVAGVKGIKKNYMEQGSPGVWGPLPRLAEGTVDQEKLQNLVNSAANPRFSKFASKTFFRYAEGKSRKIGSAEWLLYKALKKDHTNGP